jgi:hypothetical protein
LFRRLQPTFQRLDDIILHRYVVDAFTIVVFIVVQMARRRRRLARSRARARSTLSRVNRASSFQLIDDNPDPFFPADPTSGLSPLPLRPEFRPARVAVAARSKLATASRALGEFKSRALNASAFFTVSTRFDIGVPTSHPSTRVVSGDAFSSARTVRGFIPDAVVIDRVCIFVIDVFASFFPSSFFSIIVVSSPLCVAGLGANGDRRGVVVVVVIASTIDIDRARARGTH